MEFDTRLQITQERDYMVVKSNEIIQKAKYDLSLMEQKTFCYAVSKIKPDDAPDTEYTFTINDYCDVCGIERNNGKNLEDVKGALKRLRDKSFYLVEPDGSYVLIGWLSKVRISPKSGKVKIKFDEDMQKYLMGLIGSHNYTQYSLLCVLPLRSVYSLRLYEILKSYVGQRQRHKDFDTDELKAKLCAPYENFKDFRRKALEVAVREINQFTDIEVSWEPINKGRKVIKVHFDMKGKEFWDAVEANQRSADVLDGQMELQPDGTLKEVRKGKR